MEIKVNILSKETIKPSSPTHNLHNNVHLSIIDQSAPTIYVPVFFFYGNDGSLSSEELSQKLKKSLSETLSVFYPLAGEIKGAHVECNDKGSVFVDARVDCFLSDFLKDPDVELLEYFIPCDRLSREAGTWPLLVVQASFFKCGGLALCVCLSHRINDAASISSFIGRWAATALGRSDNKLYVFESSKIVELKARVASTAVKDPSRVEAITALLLKCATKASNSTKKISSPSALLHVASLRKQNIPLLSENTIGNLVFNMYANTGDETEIDLLRFVWELRQKKHETNETCKNLRAGEEASLLYLSNVKEGGEKFGRSEFEQFTCSSWCNLPFYEYDFGWGKPKWVSPGRLGFKNTIVLMDAKDGKGIEAFIFLSAEDMAFLDGDQELLEFAYSSIGRLNSNLNKIKLRSKI